MQRPMMGFRSWVIGVAAVLVACGPPTKGTRREPRLFWESADTSRAEDAMALAHDLPQVAPGVRRGVWGEGPDVTYQLLEAETPEPPHLHAEHDLTVVLLRGRGTLFVEDRQLELAAGDVVHIARGLVHHFHPSPGTGVTGLAIYTPRLEKADFVIPGTP